MIDGSASTDFAEDGGNVDSTTFLGPAAPKAQPVGSRPLTCNCRHFTPEMSTAVNCLQLFRREINDPCQ